MNVERLNALIQETTAPFRKGADVIINGKEATAEQRKAIEEKGLDALGGGVVEVFGMPPVDAMRPDVPRVDCHFIVVGVDKAKAEERKAELVSILKDWPNDRLKGGPSYIEVGGELGSQDSALGLYALGEVLGLWQVVTPAKMGITGPEGDDLAGRGMVMITGFRPE